ncbi:hypothetical protein JB92DRAFT_2856819 [Gautieria morchelliformis]|nr:hypothetical protein JB92DRAFT_2856819 [Gautieria morchelliformis]
MCDVERTPRAYVRALLAPGRPPPLPPLKKRHPVACSWFLACFAVVPCLALVKKKSFFFVFFLLFLFLCTHLTACIAFSPFLFLFLFVFLFVALFSVFHIPRPRLVPRSTIIGHVVPHTFLVPHAYISFLSRHIGRSVLARSGTYPPRLVLLLPLLLLLPTLLHPHLVSRRLLAYNICTACVQ